MRMSITTWDGTAVNDGTNYVATTPVGMGNGMASATPNYIDMGQGDPVLGGKTLAGTLFTFQVQLKGSTDATREAQRDALTALFVPNDFTLRKLYATDLDDSNRVWYLEGFTVSPPMLAEGALNLYNITIALTSPYWIEYLENSVVWNITADTETQEVTNRGNIPALPTFELDANTGKGSDAYKQFVAVEAKLWGGAIPLDLTPSALNTAALVSGGKLQADGTDLRVLVDGVSRYRWFGGGGINTTTTHIWTYVPIYIFPAMTLVTVLDNSTTPTSIVCSYTPTATAISIPGNKTIRVQSELISYQSATIDTATNKITFFGLTRNSKGSVIAAHSAGVSVTLIPLDIWIVYGDTAELAPVAPADHEPIIDLATSTNSSWVYSVFAKTENTNGFAMPVSFSGYGVYYGKTHNSSNLTGSSGYDIPMTVIGMLARRANTVNGFPNMTLRHPAGISNFAASGEKYRQGPLYADLTLNAPSTPSGTRITIYTEASPTLENTWEAVSINAPCATNPVSVRISMDTRNIGTTQPSPTCLFEMTDVTLTVYDPPVAFTPASNEAVSYLYDGTLTNNENDHTIILRKLLTKVNELITIDCEDLEIYSSDGKRLRGMIDFSGTVRDEWMLFEPGANELEFNDVGTNDVTITIRWRGRNTI